MKALLRLALAVAGLFAAVLWAWSQIAAAVDERLPQLPGGRR